MHTSLFQEIPSVLSSTNTVLFSISFSTCVKIYQFFMVIFCLYQNLSEFVIAGENSNWRIVMGPKNEYFVYIVHRNESTRWEIFFHSLYGNENHLTIL